MPTAKHEYLVRHLDNLDAERKRLLVRLGQIAGDQSATLQLMRGSSLEDITSERSETINDERCPEA